MVIMGGDDTGEHQIDAQEAGRQEESPAPSGRENLFRVIFEHAPAGMILTDHFGIIQEVNETYCHFLGYEARELIGGVYTDLMYKEDRAGEESLRRRMLSGKRSGYLYEARFTHKDGRVVWGKLDVSLLRSQANGPRQMVIVCEDIHERKRTEETLKKHDEEMAALYETSLAINAQLDLPGLLHAVVEHAARLLDAPMAALYLVLPDEKTLEMTAVYNMPGNYMGTKLYLGEGLSGRVAETGEPMMVADHSQWEGRSPIFEGAPFRRVLGVPIKYRGKVIGVINITDSERIGLFRPSEVRLVNLLADQAAVAIENARLFDAANQRANQLDLLNRIGLVITSGLEMDQVSKTILDQIQHLIKIDAFYLALYDEQTGQITFPTFYDRGNFSTLNPQDIKSNPGITGYVIDTRSPLRVDDLTFAGLSSRYAGIHSNGGPSHSFIGVPLLLGERVLGVISIQNYQPGVFTEEDTHLMETIAAQAAVAVDNARLFTEMQHRAIVDELTRLYNYRGLMELGPREVERARRFNRPLSALFYDIDDFRDFNNRYSHLVGNEVLREVGKVSTQTLRTVDLVTRFGGEEFVTLLPETRIGAATQAAERLREAIQIQRVSSSWGELGITISIGVAELTPSMKRLEELIERANQAEHLAKERGKNRVETA
jgi:diguanylate cyclase (GGDEF)-like protein/PAS domain S-box-containing protein